MGNLKSSLVVNSHITRFLTSTTSSGSGVTGCKPGVKCLSRSLSRGGSTARASSTSSRAPGDFYISLPFGHEGHNGRIPPIAGPTASRRVTKGPGTTGMNRTLFSSVDATDHEEHCSGNHRFGTTGLSPNSLDKTTLLSGLIAAVTSRVSTGPISESFIIEILHSLLSPVTGSSGTHGSLTTGSTANSTRSCTHDSILEKTVETCKESVVCKYVVAIERRPSRVGAYWS